MQCELVAMGSSSHETDSLVDPCTRLAEYSGAWDSISDVHADIAMLTLIIDAMRTNLWSECGRG